MNHRIALLASFLALPLSAQQDTHRPSPFPEKNRERAAAAEAAAKSTSRSRAERRVRARAAGAIGSPAPPTSGATSSETGRASFFSSSGGGALTASGARLDASGLVAAHATYPLGSLVKVTNLANGKTVEVEIVDRFPVSRRIINVSEAAAKELGFVEAGTAEVHLEPVARAPASLDHTSESLGNLRERIRP